MKIAIHLFLSILLVATSGVVSANDQVTASDQISQAELEQILAPIALYPDTVLSHILIASTYPLEVIQAERWSVANPSLNGSNAVEAVNGKNWDPSVKALVAFPQILKRLSEDLDWTQRLGDAFLQDEQMVLASVQTLRQRAYEAGSLNDMEKVSVTQDEGSIVIEPKEREVVYLPYYNTRVVYGPWHWSLYPPVYWNYPYYNNHYVGYNDNRFYWGPRTHVSFGFFFSSFHWSNHHIVRISHNHYRPNHYYNHHQIVKHNYAQKWSHNPTHRRGVTYRNAYLNKVENETNKNNQLSQPIVTRKQNTLRNNNTLRNAPLVRQNMRDRRVNVQQRTNRVNNINQNRTVNQAVQQQAVINRAVVQSNTRRSNSVQTAPLTTHPIVRNSNSPKPVVQRSAPKPNKSIRQETKNQNKPTNVRKQTAHSNRNGTRRNPR